MKLAIFQTGSKLVPVILSLWTCPVALGADDAVLHAAAGDLQVTLRRLEGGITVEGLKDAVANQELLAREPLPLFVLTLRNGASNELTLAANSGWRECSVARRSSHLELRWSKPAQEALAGLTVTARAKLDARNSALRWKLEVAHPGGGWGVWRVVFPQVALAELGTNASVFFPRGPGEVWRGAWDKPFNYRGTYPDGWCSMQFLAANPGGDRATGLYLATHDPWGSTKDILVKSVPETHSLRLSFDHPAPDMGVAGNGFVLEGEAVWQLLRGDWFDAATIYRGWAAKEAKWWPRRAEAGRKDSPAWMRELNAWAMTGGAPGDCVPVVKGFREFMGQPVGFHWYNWHQIPFDNDYPHYFPAKDGFAEGVAQLKSAGVFPMPYINGRLWDSHDRGSEDFEFTRVALSGVTKQPDGSPYLERYGSKETNGEPVSLGVMCPSTPLWQNTVSNIVLRLLRECGTSGVYIDQVAAAAPKLCMDRSHGHPLGGGHWWTESYWKMLEAIRRAKPRETMLTTECNGEPFIRCFDGYLTWHWQHDGQVPAFPAVYGGQIQMFGRAYRGGATKDLALRMKAGQQLVFGEQLGWLDPALLKETQSAEFFRQLAQMRAKFNRYLSAGQMARPPRLVGEVPQVKADWQWSGEWWVTTDAVLTGAWRLPAEHKLVLFFVNVSDAAVTASVRPAGADWGVSRADARCAVTSSLGDAGAATKALGAPAVFAPKEAQAWELRTSLDHSW